MPNLTRQPLSKDFLSFSLVFTTFWYSLFPVPLKLWKVHVADGDLFYAFPRPKQQPQATKSHLLVYTILIKVCFYWLMHMSRTCVQQMSQHTNYESNIIICITLCLYNGLSFTETKHHTVGSLMWSLIVLSAMINVGINRASRKNIDALWWMSLLCCVTVLLKHVLGIVPLGLPWLP